MNERIGADRERVLAMIGRSDIERAATAIAPVAARLHRSLPSEHHGRMALAVSELIGLLDGCHGDNPVVVRATLADATMLSVWGMTIGAGQVGPDGEGREVRIEWEPGAEATTRS